MKNFFILFCILVVLLTATSSLAQQQPTTFDCVALNGNVTVDPGQNYATGIQIIGTSNRNCSISIKNLQTKFISFVHQIDGIYTDIVISGVTFADISTDNSFELPMPVADRFAAIAFFAPITNIGRILIQQNTWRTTNTYVSAQADVSLSWIFFAGGINTQVYLGVKIHENLWNASVTSLPTGVDISTQYNIPLNFVLFSEYPVIMNNQGITLAKNRFLVDSHINQSFALSFIYSDNGFTNCPITLFSNEIYYYSVWSLSNTYNVFATGDSSNINFGDSGIFIAWYNNVTYRVFQPNKLAGNNFGGSVANFGGPLSYASTGTPKGDFTGIDLVGNQFIIEAQAATAYFALLDFVSDLDLYAINITDNVFETEYETFHASNFAFLISSAQVNAVSNPAVPGRLGTMRISGNDWAYYDKSRYASQTNLWGFQFLPKDSNELNINALEIVGNHFLAQMNNSLTTGVTQFFLAEVAKSGGAVSPIFNGILISENNVEIFDTGLSLTVYFFVNYNNILVQNGFEISINDLTIEAPGTSTKASYYADTLQSTVKFKAPISFFLNDIAITRYSCFQGGPSPCDEQTAYGLPLSVTMMSFMSIANDVKFEEPVAFTANEITIFSNPVLLYDVASYTFQGAQIVRSGAQTFQTNSGFQLTVNTIAAQIATPMWGDNPLPGGSNLNRVPLAIMQCTSGSSPTLTQYIIRSNSLTIRSNVIEAICAPCYATGLAMNISFGTAYDASNLQMNNLTLQANNITVALPSQLDSTLFDDPFRNGYFVTANQVMFCLPPVQSTSFVCKNPLIVYGFGHPVANMAIINSATAYIFPTSWGIKPDYNPQDPGVNWPQHFGDVSFMMSLVFAANNSFPDLLSNSPADMFFSGNTFTWGPVARGSQSWGQFLAGSFITTIFTTGTSILDTGMNLYYQYLDISECDQGDLLGIPFGQMLAVVNLKYTKNCPPTTTTTTVTTTSTTTAAPTTTTTTTPSSSSAPSSSTTTTTTTTTATTLTQTPSPTHDNSNSSTGAPAPEPSGLSGGATAAVVIVVLLVVGVGAGFAYVKRDRLKAFFGKNRYGYDDGSSSDLNTAAGGSRRQAFDAAGYGSMTAADELENRRMSIASSSAQEV